MAASIKIYALSVYVSVDENGEMVGVVTIREALRRAEEAGLDLVEISRMPIHLFVKFLITGNLNLNSRKKLLRARKKQKQLKLRKFSCVR